MSDLTIGGDTDRWMLMSRESADGYPLIVRARVNNDFIIDFETTNAVSAVICDLNPDQIQDNGMPTSPALTGLQNLEDLLISSLSSLQGRCFHTASVTGDGRRVLYFAHGRGAPISELIDDIDTDIVGIEVTSDFALSTYREFITPTPLDTQLDGDRQVVSALEENGDQPDVPRKVDFWFYGDRLKLQLLVAKLAKLGFEVDHWLNDPSGVVLNRLMAIQIAAFYELTPQLLDLAQESGVEYDGWETFAATPGNNSPRREPPAKPPSFLNKLFGAKKN
ncbi:ribonuclease E inhibitor RraB [Sphingopyxis sp. KK2]|uniref:ribonuclease E inhibitor RraB n=1 Tax=Sphingopyxis sp. KK2 TaxID=1855727 RepID=UPI00097E71B0|nr:ribonuclease E inhibitor RraB [Sphingopyxis sp. KK2]